MILLLEGVDGTGKTTLAEAMRTALEVPVLSFKVPPTPAYEHFRTGIEAQLAISPHFILDRCHLSNRAYGGRFGGGVLTDAEYVGLDRLLASHNAWLFLMVDMPSNIAARIAARSLPANPEGSLGRAEIGEVQNAFLRLSEASSIRPQARYTLPLLIDQGKPTMQFVSLADQLREQIRIETARAAFLRSGIDHG